MSIIDQIWFWIQNDTIDFVLTVLFSILFFEGLVPAWYDRWQDKIDNNK